MKSERILITGATGMIGRLVVEALTRAGRPVTVLARPSSDASRFAGRADVTVVRGDLDRPDSLPEVLDGVDRAFLLTNSSPRSEEQQLRFVQAAADAGVARLVKLSQLHASSDSPVRFLRYHAAVEQAVRRTTMDWTFIRPNLVLQAFLPMVPSFADGVLRAPIDPSARVSVVDARDIAACAAAALSRQDLAREVLDVTGPRAVTHGEIAQAFAAATGRALRFEQVPGPQYVDAVVAGGMDRWQAEGLGEDFAHYSRGEAAAVSDGVERATGSGARSVETFAADHAAALSGR